LSKGNPHFQPPNGVFGVWGTVDVQAKMFFAEARKFFGEAKMFFSEARKIFGEAKKIFSEAKKIFGRARNIFGRARNVFASGGTDFLLREKTASSGPMVLFVLIKTSPALIELANLPFRQRPIVNLYIINRAIYISMVVEVSANLNGMIISFDSASYRRRFAD
jgi:hypothetical protein